jgi:hypothetical protein
MAYGESPFDGSMTAAVSANVSFPTYDRYGPHFQALVQGILQVRPVHLGQSIEPTHFVTGTDNTR